MEAKKFVENLNGEEFIYYDKKTLEEYRMPEKICENLSRYGLPESAAPYLNFEIVDMAQLENAEDGYFYLGYTGNGDWICINILNGKILIIDHEMYDDYMDEDETDVDEDKENVMPEDDEGEDYEYEGFTLVNSSLDALYGCLVSYKEFIQKEMIKGTDAYIEEVEKLKDTFANIDSAAMQIEDSFWNQEIEELKEN